jgi:hypothetical protein
MRVLQVRHVCLETATIWKTNGSRNAVCRDLTDGKDSITLKDPGSDNLLVTEEGSWNDQILSFQCYKEG